MSLGKKKPKVKVVSFYAVELVEIASFMKYLVFSILFSFFLLLRLYIYIFGVSFFIRCCIFIPSLFRVCLFRFIRFFHFLYMFLHFASFSILYI